MDDQLNVPALTIGTCLMTNILSGFGRISLPKQRSLLLFLPQAPQRYTDVRYPTEHTLCLAVAGLPEQLLFESQPWCVRLPMRNDARSLNHSIRWPSAYTAACANGTLTACWTRGIRNCDWK